MAPLSRVQFQNKVARLTKKIGVCKFKDKLSQELLDIARSVFEMYAPDPSDGSTDVLYEMPDAMEAKDFFKSLLPPPDQIFTDHFFTLPLFPVVILHDLAALFGFQTIDTDFKTLLNLTEENMLNKNLMMMVWFCYVLECDIQGAQGILTKFIMSRRSSNPMIRMTPLGGFHIPFDDSEPATIRDLSELPKRLRSFRSVRDHFIEEDPIGLDYIHRSNDSTKERQNNDSDCSLKADYVQQTFKDNRFSGDFSEDIQETLQMYGICSRTYSLSPSQKADLFVYILDGPARRLFLEHCRDGMTFQEITNFMLKEYVSDAREAQIKETLENLRLRSFMESNDIQEVSEGLTKLVGHITEISPQGPPDFRSDTHKIDYLRRAISDPMFLEWARVPILNITPERYTFNSFVATLHGSIQINKQLQLLSGASSSASLTGVVAADNLHTHLTSYGRHPRHLSKPYIKAKVHHAHPKPRSAPVGSYNLYTYPSNDTS